MPLPSGHQDSLHLSPAQATRQSRHSHIIWCLDIESIDPSPLLRLLAESQKAWEITISTSIQIV